MASKEPKTLPLFPTRDAGPLLSPPIPKSLSKRKQRTAQASRKIDLGQHPAIGLPLHPWAPRLNRAPADRTPRDHTCGTCAHLQVDLTLGPQRRRLYCELSATNTEVRRWWPSCVQEKPIEEAE